MEKDLDPLRELEHEDVDESVRAPTETLSVKSSRHDPTARMERPSSEEEGGFSRPANPVFAPPPPRYTPPPAPAISQMAPSWHGAASPNNRHYGAAPRVRLEENIQPRQTPARYSAIIPWSLIFGLGIAMAFAAIAATRGQHPDAPVVVAQPAVPPITSVPAPQASQPEMEQLGFIDPLFGQYAAKKCSDRCDARGGPSRDACARGCSQFQIPNFGRRITLEHVDPTADGEEIVNRCMKREIVLSPETSGSRWNQSLLEAIKLVGESPAVLQGNDYGRMRGIYHTLLDANRAIRLPPAGTTAEIALTKDLVRSTCLYANLALVRIAFGVVDAAQDNCSARSYRQMQQVVEPKAQEVAASITAQAKNLKITGQANS